MAAKPKPPTAAKLQRCLREYRAAPSPDLDRKLRLLVSPYANLLLPATLSPESEDYDRYRDLALDSLVLALQEFPIDSDLSPIDFAMAFARDRLQSLTEPSLGQTEPPQPLHRSPPPARAMQHAVTPDSTLPSTLKATTLELLQTYRATPSAALRNRLVELNIGLARREAYHWLNQCNEPFEDLLQVGTIGLIRAIERFDPERGHAFSSFAVPYIRGEIQHYLRDKSPTVRMPRRWYALYNQACKDMQQLRIDLGREPGDRDIAAALGIAVTEWQDIKVACQNRTPLSLDAPVRDDDEGTSSLGDLMPDRRYHSFQLSQEDSIRLQQALSHLEERTRQIVEFVFIKEFTHREVAEMLGISAVTVSRQVKKGLGILKQVMGIADE